VHRQGNFSFPSGLLASPEASGLFCNYFSFLIANLAQRYHEFLIENRNHMSKSKRFGGLRKYAQAFKFNPFRPICYSQCACCTSQLLKIGNMLNFIYAGKKDYQEKLFNTDSA